MEVFDFCDLNDDVFVDDVKLNIISSKLVSRVYYKFVVERCVGNFLVLEEFFNRSFLDEFVLQMVLLRYDDFIEEDG